MSSGGQTTSTTNTAPWSAQQPYLSGLFSGAQSAYNAFGSNPASSVAGFTPMQDAAFQQTQNASAGNPGSTIAGLNSTAGGFDTSLMSGGFLSNNPSNAGYSALASGAPTANNTFSAFANGMPLNSPAASTEQSLMAGGGPAGSSLSQFASGANQGNPFEMSQINAAIDPITRAFQTATAPTIASQMEAGGRFGSGAMTNADNQAQQNLVGQLGNAVAPIVSNMYQTNQGNQLSAAGTLGGLQLGGASQYNTNLQDMLAGASGLSSNTLGGLGGLGGNYNTGVGQMVQGMYGAPATAGMDWNSITNLGNAGAQGQTLNQSMLNSPFNLLGQYGNLIQGQYGGTGTSTQPYFTNPAAGALGGAATGALLGSAVPGIGTGIGAVGGGLLGLLSDRRAKEDIQRVGELNSGLPVYSYRYKAGGPTQIGVMADEAKQIFPHAVKRGFDGLDRVNYGALH